MDNGKLVQIVRAFDNGVITDVEARISILDNLHHMTTKELFQYVDPISTHPKDLLAACKGVADDIEGWLEDEWDGNKEGWQCLIDRLRTASANTNLKEQQA